MTRDCTHHGHIWLTADEKPYARQRGVDLDATVDVHCQHCPETRLLPKYSQFSGPRSAGQPIDKTIPPGIKTIVARAVADAQKTNDGPVPKP